MRRFLKKTFPRTADFLHRNRRHAPTAALIVGLIWDSLTLGRPDQLFDNAVLLFYLIVSGGGILLMSRRRERGVEPSLALRTAIQFAFGNLTSGLFILYSISGTLAGNWVFFALLVALLIGNELLGERYGQLRFNLSIYYLLLFAYLALIVPVLFSQIGTHIFVIAGIFSIGIVAFYGVLLERLAPTIVRESATQLIVTISSIFLAFNVLYFTHLIPPVPLALRDAGVFHNLVRTDDAYRVSFIPGEWYEPFKKSDDVIYITNAADRTYCFSSVFAPAGIETPIVHHWEFYDTEAGEWQTRSRIPFEIAGGRDTGYRGYTYTQSLTEGTWRCSVETERGALIGRRTFEAIQATSAPDLIQETR